MKQTQTTLYQIMSTVPDYIKQETNLEFGVSDRLAELMEERGITKRSLAQALGKRPSEVTKWLSGQHNFTLRTIAMLSSFFGEPLMKVCCKH